MIMIEKRKRYISKRYLAYIRGKACLVCGDVGEPHHIVSRGAGGSDLTAVPLCRRHHSEMESQGKLGFWKKYYFERSDLIDFLRGQVWLLQGYIETLEKKEGEAD